MRFLPSSLLRMSRLCAGVVTLGLSCLTTISAAPAAAYDARLLAELRWRAIGPMRGGCTRAAVGVPGQPNLLYIGACSGGVWKTDDYGRTWQPIFDDQPTSSIGAIAVAPSDPNVIYVGSGEGSHRPGRTTGNGVYRSADAGKTWTHLGLRGSQQVSRIAVDSRDAKRLFVAVLGHPYGPNPERGIFRSTDGGQSFQKVLYVDEDTGANDVAIDPSNPDVVYAALWEARVGPWESGVFGGPGGGLFKSSDGGTTWHQLKGGLPSGADALIQANLAVAPTRPARIYASVAAGKASAIYRTDDGGENWVGTTPDPRPVAPTRAGDLPSLAVDPADPDVVYAAGHMLSKSTDGGRTWNLTRGAPGGDDYQRLWINPVNPAIMLATGDRGAIVSVNGGRTWSSWYNQSTAELIHATVDGAFPYRVCGGQLEGGSVCVSSRGNDGQITVRDWSPAGAEEHAYAVPDPLNSDLVYSGQVARYDRRTGQSADVAPKPLRSGGFRTGRTAPLVFSTADPHVLYFGANTVWRTADGGQSWKEMSPDLTRKTWNPPPSLGKYSQAAGASPMRRGVIAAIAPSPLDVNRIWAGTDDGLIQTTSDGGSHWRDVTPPQLTAWASVSTLDAGPFDALTLYAAVDTQRLDDFRPHILRTHDGGRTWTEIVGGIPEDTTVHAVREDPRKKGLLFAGTDRGVYVSFDDGGHWQPLRLNMPATPVRDLTIKDDDLVAATQGRGFWILDDLAPLRQAGEATASGEYLFKPPTIYRVRWNMNTDTPLPPDEPAAKNPPDGAFLDYYLGAAAYGPMTLEIFDSGGALVRRYASTDFVDPGDSPLRAMPEYWVRPRQTLSNQPGLHRFLWDLHYTPLDSGPPSYPLQAVSGDTAPSVTSLWVMPGRYNVRLTVNGHSYHQYLTVKMDPRVRIPPASLLQQFTVAKRLYDDAAGARQAIRELDAIRVNLWRITDRAAQTPAGADVVAFDRQAAALLGGFRGLLGPGGHAPAPGDAPSLNSAFTGLMEMIPALQQADGAPSAQLLAASAARRESMAEVMTRWAALKVTALSNLNAKLLQSGLPAVTAGPAASQ